MVLCDAIHTDSTTGKKTILGTFSAVHSDSFPTKINLSVYYAITDCPADFEMTFRVVHSKHLFEDGVEPALEAKYPGKSPSPLAVVEGQFFLQNAVLQEPGVYHCELLAEDSLLMSRRLIALGPDEIQGEL
jgi:hypothetical protein